MAKPSYLRGNEDDREDWLRIYPGHGLQPQLPTPEQNSPGLTGAL